MAGMLPGVECARRRRSGGWQDSPGTSGNVSTRRSSFCLYTSNHELSPLTSSSSLQPRSKMNQQAYQDDEKLGGVAREAKERLDVRLRAPRKSETQRNHSSQFEILRCIEGSTMMSRDLQMEVFRSSSKRIGSNTKRFNWAKFGWEASDQVECAVCLEQFKAGETLVSLPCAHRFHSRCLVPWLETHAHCPCCRMDILT